MISKASCMLLHAKVLRSSQRSAFFDAVVEDRDGRVSYERTEVSKFGHETPLEAGSLTHDDAWMEAFDLHAFRFAASRQCDVGSA